MKAVILALTLGSSAAQPTIVELRPDAGPSIQSAISALPEDAAYTILRLAPGTYREKIVIPREAPPFKLLGSGPETTRIVWNDSAETPGPKGRPLGTSASSTLTIESDDFAAENLTFENDHGPGVQAVALSIGGDRGVFRHCTFLGWQDTLLLRKKRQFFDRCRITGSVDFIFGASTAFFNRCLIECRADGYITAASTPAESDFGFVFSRCTVTAAEGLRVDLGRPWKPDASVHFLASRLPAAIRPGGWNNWENPENEARARYGEWRSSGPGAAPQARVAWSRQLDDPDGRGMSRPWRILSKWDPDAVLSPERVSRLPADAQSSWWACLDRSRTAMDRSRAVLVAEMKSAGLDLPGRPADGGKPPSDSRDPDWYRSAGARQLARSVISFQTPEGGWSKAIDYSRGPRQPGTHWSAQGGDRFPWHYVGTLDNGATTSEIRFLARCHQTARDTDAADAVIRGLGFLLAAQYPNGGWPQVWPLQGGYHDHITFNDDAMIHVLELLDDVANRREPFRFIDSDLRLRCAAAVKAGIDCLIASQFRAGDQPTVWCAQHEPLGLLPADARMQEPASLSASESIPILRFLIRRAPATPESDAAIAGGIRWLESSRITGIRREKRDGRNFYVEDAEDDGAWWGRFHDLETNRPIFSGSKDGRIYDSFAELFATNPTEYQYFTDRGRSFLAKEAAEWKARP